jgi:hypothetical protein
MNPCYGCPRCPVEVGWVAARCPDIGLDVCVEFRLRQVVREQWIWEQVPPAPCPACGSLRKTEVEHPELPRVMMQHCQACGKGLGPVGASPLEVCNRNVHLFGRYGKPIARELLRGCICSADLAHKLGWTFVPHCETPEGSVAYQRIRDAIARGVPVATILAMLGGWV